MFFNALNITSYPSIIYDIAYNNVKSKKLAIANIPAPNNIFISLIFSLFVSFISVLFSLDFTFLDTTETFSPCSILSIIFCIFKTSFSIFTLSEKFILIVLSIKFNEADLTISNLLTSSSIRVAQ